MDNILKIWTVYKSPSDFPGQYVAREFAGDKPTENYKASTNEQDVLDWIKERSALTGEQGEPVMLPREENDDPCILYSFV